MKIYKCPKCKEEYLECDLLKIKCSENGVYAYIFK